MPRRLSALLTVVAVATAVYAQDPPRFEVVSIRRNTSGSLSTSVKPELSGRITIVNTTLHSLIHNANNIPSYLLTGGPEWLLTERWDITAAAAKPLENRQQMELMLRQLLIDRFKLTLRRETREMPIFALVLARPERGLGARMKVTTIDCEAGAQAAAKAGTPVPCGFDVSGSALKATGMPIRRLVQTLAQMTGRMVTDDTGLTAVYDIDLTWTLEPRPGADPPAPLGDGPSLFTALEEQLGLRLDARRGPVEVLIVERVERPAEN